SDHRHLHSFPTRRSSDLDAARVVSCATTSSGATSFALCAAGPAMNEEWRIAAECAVETGGNPIGFAGCTATQLTINELTKCFKRSEEHTSELQSLAYLVC